MKDIASLKGVRDTRTTAACSAPCNDRNTALLLLPLGSQCYMIRRPLVSSDERFVVIHNLLHNKRMIRNRALCGLHLSHTADSCCSSYSASSFLDNGSQGPAKATVSNTARGVALYPAGSSLHSCCCCLCRLYSRRGAYKSCLPSGLTAWLSSVYRTCDGQPDELQRHHC